jgi:SAM-dependent methyltransferase
MEQRFVFDQVASLYSASRPDYPEALVDDVLCYAAVRSGDRILEVGCGTGQATKAFASRGHRILATDPGAEMLRGARETLAGFDNVEYLQTTFEAFPAAQPVYRLIIAAQSWHWVSPHVRLAKAASLLAHDGSLAVFGHVPVGLPVPLREKFRQIYVRRIGRWGPPPEAGYLPDGPFKAWFDESGLFQPVAHKSYSWQWRHSTSTYADFLRTRSDHRMLAAQTRDDIVADVAEAIDGEGGTLDVDYETHLYMARRT